MKKTLGFLIVFLIAFTFLFSGCSKIDFNAKIISGGYIVNSEWQSQNLTLGAFDQVSGNYQTNAPRSFTHVIKTQNDLNVVFDDFEAVDFSKKIVIVYCYTCVYGRENFLKRVELINQNLVIEFDIKKAKIGVGDATMPYTRFAVFLIDKVLFNQVTVIYHGQ